MVLEMRLYDKADLAKLKDSKPVPIIAHSHEVIVPVVYSGMVNRFLEHKGIHLPLTHHQLADMKREADVPGYAKGTKDLKKKKKKRAKKTKKNVIAPVGLGIAPAPSRAQMLYDSLRPDHYSTIRPMVQPGYVQPPQIPDYKKEADEHLKREQEAITRYRKELMEKEKVNQMKQLSYNEHQWEQSHRPLRQDEDQLPIRESEQFGAPHDFRKPSEVVIEEIDEEEAKKPEKPRVAPREESEEPAEPAEPAKKTVATMDANESLEWAHELVDEVSVKQNPMAYLMAHADMKVYERCLSLWRVPFKKGLKKQQKIELWVDYVTQH